MIYPTPKFVVDSTTFIINNSYCDPVFSDPQVLTQTSTLTGHREFILKGDRSHFIIYIHVEKYSDPRSTLVTLRGFMGTKVNEFYVDENDDPVRKATGNAATFVVTNVEPLYLDNLVYYTYIIMRFDSTDYVKPLYEKYRYMGDKNDNIFTDKYGNKIIF